MTDYERAKDVYRKRMEALRTEDDRAIWAADILWEKCAEKRKLTFRQQNALIREVEKEMGMIYE
jgi:hypothetical protein